MKATEGMRARSVANSSTPKSSTREAFGARQHSAALGRSTIPTSGRNTAIVIGGGLAGTLAAWALREVAEHVVVVERDRYPQVPEFRAGVPQARHAHLLLEAGHRALEELMPGIRAELLAAGAARVPMSGDLRWLSSAGWMADHTSCLAFLSCSRPLLDHVVRARLSAEPSIQFLEATEVIGLLGTPHAVTGVRIRERGRATTPRELAAELVVDASGRTSSLPTWLTHLGCPPPHEERVDAGTTYISRLYHRPPALDPGFRALYLQTQPPDEPRTGVLLPVEDNRWIVSLSGVRGAEPAAGEAGFAQMLSKLRDPILRETLNAATPAGPVRIFCPGASVRRHYELRGTPDRLVVVGDAAATHNPVYGQGMTVAILCARALRAAALGHNSIGAATARVARKQIAVASKNTWLMSSTEDLRFPTTLGTPAGTLVRAQHRYLDRVLDRATTDPSVTAVFQQVMSLVAPPTALLRPRVLASVLAGGR